MSGVGLRRITKAFGAATALRGVDVEVSDHEFFSIVGPSGCGKSTLLRIIAGLEKPDTGTVTIGGTDVSGYEPAERGIGMVFQNYALFPHLSAADNIAFGLKGRLPRGQIRERVAEMAGLLELDAGTLARRPRQLSGGQRQRVALGRALIRRPRVLLMDEPLSGADALLRERMRAELRRFHDRAGATTVYVTHDQREAMSMSDRLMVLDKGQMQQVGRPIDVFRDPRTAFAARFLGSPGMNLWPMKVARDGEAVRLDGAGEVSWTLPAGLGGELPGEVLVGVRPERFRLGADPRRRLRLPGELTAVEPQGDVALLHVRHGDTEVVAAVSADEAQLAPELIELCCAHSDLYFFSVPDGRRLTPSQQGTQPTAAGPADSDRHAPSRTGR